MTTKAIQGIKNRQGLEFVFTTCRQKLHITFFKPLHLNKVTLPGKAVRLYFNFEFSNVLRH